MSYAGGREDYGYPKSMARFTPEDASGSSIQVQTFGGNFHPGNRAGWHPVLDIGLGGNGAPAPAVGPLSAADAHPAPHPSSWRSLREVPDLVRSLLSDAAHHEVRQLFLKQFRDATDGTHACYQAVVEAPITVLRSSWRPSLFQQVARRRARARQPPDHQGARDRQPDDLVDLPAVDGHGRRARLVRHAAGGAGWRGLRRGGLGVARRPAIGPGTPGGRRAGCRV